MLPPQRLDAKLTLKTKNVNDSTIPDTHFLVINPLKNDLNREIFFQKSTFSLDCLNLNTERKDEKTKKLIVTPQYLILVRSGLTGFAGNGKDLTGFAGNGKSEGWRNGLSHAKMGSKQKCVMCLRGEISNNQSPHAMSHRHRWRNRGAERALAPPFFSRGPWGCPILRVYFYNIASA